jgi:UDP-N-acetylmuramoylalanine-D-glutamate ligase
MLHELKKKNYISVLGRIFPEHLDWHGSFDKYVQAKLNILQGSEIAIVHTQTLHEYPQGLRCKIIPYGK